MNTHEFQRLIADVIFNSRQGGKEVTIYLNGTSIMIGDFVWHPECNEFHVMPKTKRIVNLN